MFNLNSGVHLHEEVLIPIHNTLEGGDAVETNGFAKALRFLLHGFERLDILTEYFNFRVFAGFDRMR